MTTTDERADQDVNTYEAAVDFYRAAGWSAPLPLPPRQKEKPPWGFTGHDGIWPTEEHFTHWLDERPADANLALRVDYGVVGIDVDAYDNKTGRQTLHEAENQWGPLPHTFRSSARPADAVSGIRLFRVPEDVMLRGRIQFDEPRVGDIEIILPHLRYVVAWPSIHPKNSQRYRWHGLDGHPMPEGKVPELADLPDLPQAWVEALSQDAARDEMFDGSGPDRTRERRRHIDEQLYERLIGSEIDGHPDALVSDRLDRALMALTDGGGSRYDTTRDHVAALMRLRALGRVGVPHALNTLLDAYVLEVADTRPPVVAASEFLRSVEGAAALIAATMPRHDMPNDAGEGDTRTETPGHLRDRLLTLNDLANLPPVRPLIDGLLYRDTLAQLAGQPGCYKSFAVTAMACAVASGEGFGTHRVPQEGTVVYVAAEGANAMRPRILAWCEEAGVDPQLLDDRLFILPLPLQLNETMKVRQAVELVQEKGADLLILDTRARCTLGLDENSATEQGLAIDAAEKIRAAAGCTVLGVHHSSRAGSAGRGSNAWDGAVWTDLRMEGKNLQATISCEKHKDVPSGCKHHFELAPHTVSDDLMPNRLEVERQTLVLRSGNGAGIKPHMTQSQLAVLEIVRKNVRSDGLQSMEVVRFAESHGISKSATYDALKALAEDGHIKNIGLLKRPRYVSSMREQ